MPHPYNDADADYWLNCVKANEFKLSIFQNSVLIGGISLDAERDDGYCEFGYWLGFEGVVRQSHTRLKVPRSCKISSTWRKLSG